MTPRVGPRVGPSAARPRSAARFQAGPPWLRLLALDGDLATAEPKTLCYRILHAAARLAPGHRPPAPALTRTAAAPTTARAHQGPWNPGHPARQPGHVIPPL
jgi:hypothetical protein